MATLAQVDLQKLWEQVISAVSTPQYAAFLSRTKPLGLLPGEVLDSLQELTRLAVQTSLGERSRLMLDIDNFRSDKKAELAELAKQTAEEVKSTGEAIKLRPMNAFERKVVHDTIQEIGLTSESEGEDPDRCVVVLPS